jgi:flagellar hook assembly protein FlgD
LTRLAVAVFVLLIGATCAAFFAAQRVKGEPPVAQVLGLDRHFSPNDDDRKDVNRFRVRLREESEVSIDVVDHNGDAVRRLADGDTVGPSRPLPLRWDGRTDAGTQVPDGAYRVRVTLRREGRSVIPPRTMFVDTEPPRPRIREILPEQIVGPAPGPMTFRLGAVSRRVPARVRIFRTDGGEPIEVASLRTPAGSRSVDWNGLVDGRPAPPGTYQAQVTTPHVAGNRGSTPVDVPPQPGERRGEPGFTVRAIAAEMPMRPVTAGDRVTVNVDARRRPYRWRLRRVGRTNPVAQGREGVRRPVQFRAPEGDSGLYLLELNAGASRTSVPILVQSSERARMLVVVPSLTWSGSAEVDEDFDGAPDTLETARQISWPRVLPGGLPADLTDRVAPLLVFLDRAGIRYDLTSDLDLMLTENPRASDRQGVLLAGAERWITRGYARRLRRYVTDGGRVASFGTESLRRGVTVLRNDERTAGRLARPTQPSDQDPFGARFEALRRTAEPVTLSLIGGDPDFGLLQGFDGALGGFRALEESEPPGEGRGELLAALGVETAPEVEEPGVPEELPPPARPALAATRIGEGMMIRVGLPEWSARLGDRQVAQITLNVADLLRGFEPRIRSAP